ncbi:MAG: type II toxin-antitoxin system RelE/ParE family toxin [Candidatus Hydrogenedentes bacterium]|nr:type II toxin-antitoxin system RelE/ParE family toxin [Candidatus Hydrogenedentota bacterium]
MNSREIVFSPRARERMAEIAEYLYAQQLSNEFVAEYLQRFEDWLERILGEFPESGVLLPEYGPGVRRVVYQQYSLLYRVQNDAIEILTVYRMNRP